MRRPPLKRTVAKATMNAGNSIHQPNVVRALALSSLLVAIVAATAQDKPSPALLRRSPDSTGVTARSTRTARISDSEGVQNAPTEVADPHVVPASDTEGVNRVRIRAVEPPADYVPSATRRTTPSTSSSRTSTTTKAATNKTTEELPPPPKQSMPQVANRLPPLGRTIGTPPASAPLRNQTAAPSRAPSSTVVRNTTPAPAQAAVASTQDSVPAKSAAAKPATSTAATKQQPPRTSPAKTTSPKESSGAIARGMAYFDPSKIMPWMRQDDVEKLSTPSTEAQSVAIESSSAKASAPSLSVSQESPKPKVAQKAKKRSTKTKTAQVAASDDSTSSSSSFFNPLKSVRQIWSGTEPPASKTNHLAKTKGPLPEEAPQEELAEQAVPKQKPSMLAQLFGRGRSPEKVISKTNRSMPSDDSEVEIASSEPAGDVAIEHTASAKRGIPGRTTPKPFASLSDDEVTEVSEAFQTPAPVTRPMVGLPAGQPLATKTSVTAPPADPRAANAKLGAPIIELADEEVASTESDKVIR
jgi:hypothetical protein